MLVLWCQSVDIGHSRPLSSHTLIYTALDQRAPLVSQRKTTASMYFNMSVYDTGGEECTGKPGACADCCPGLCTSAAIPLQGC